MFDALIKIGGSLYAESRLGACAAAWASLAAEYRLLVVPGGGPFADQVRVAAERFRLDDSAAHWMAVLAMDQYGYLLADLAPDAVLARDLDAAAAACDAGRLAVLAPSTLLLQHDPLPHSWQVTSDSIAAWLAGTAGIDLLVLLKSVAGLESVDPFTQRAILRTRASHAMLARSGLVDPCFGAVCPRRARCWIIDGRQPQRLAELLRLGYTHGTQVTHAGS